MSPGVSTTDTIDLADIARSLRRGWRWIVGGVVAGGIAALFVLAFVPPRFDASASAIIRASPDASGSLLAKLGDAGGPAAALLGGGGGSPIETDIQILSSRAVVGAVVDTLLLQVEARSPAVPARTLVTRTGVSGSFKHADATFERTATGAYHFSMGSVSGSAPSGGEVRLPMGSITLAGTLPDKFTIRIFDHDDAVLRVTKSLSVSKAGGEVVRVAFRAGDSITSAMVPNAVLVDYLARRKTDDRGANAHRAEFLAVQIDSTANLAAQAEDALRRFQERSGIFDASLTGKLQLEGVTDLRKALSTLEIEEGSLDQLLAQIAAGRMSPRQLVGYPSFLKSPGINDLLQQLAELETERTKLLQRRLESDDQVVAISRSIANIEGQLVPLARAYSGALQHQRADITAQIATITTALTSFPGAAQTGARLTREVVRLNQLSLALQAQLVQARLAAISEGGDVRALDRATPPKKPSFPDPLLTTVLGLGVGLLVGLASALLAGTHGRYLNGAGEIERVFGVPVIRYLPGTALLMSGSSAARTLLLIPLDARTSTADVAGRIANTALARGGSATVLDLTDATDVPGGIGAVAMIDRAENDSTLVVVRLPGLSHDATAAVLSHSRPVLLVAPVGKVGRHALSAAVETLRRLDIPCAGVVLAEPAPRALASA